ncbi:MAG TPA: AbrB/MazE/SpoVT family DNA-binding domain-containing protein [Candidatus Saccharimonadales bacterium]|nr:AbrB/MazE/SpoVT family DNA-binding domain-containing protein [Candidatus Saccharimonadales bacterium]
MGITQGPKFFGSATVGPKGQIVIPGDARKALNIQTGDKVLIISIGSKGNMLTLCPASQVEDMLGHLNDHVNTLRQAVDADKEQEKSK